MGRDARLSGGMVRDLVVGTLTGMGFDVVDIDLASTPTTELAVTGEDACGGLILTASHNPIQWNALKLLNEKGEFLNAEEGAQVLKMAAEEDFNFAGVHELGHVFTNTTYVRRHNSVGGIIVPQLLKALGVTNIVTLNCEATGHFAHTPEPIPENLGDIASLVRESKADVGFVVDPDVDRLAIISDGGDFFGEEYTLVAVADYVLSHTPGNTVSNLSSSRALRDVTTARGGQYNAAAVGEVNVTTKMKETGAVIGGEGNGGVIYPALHYGRDAMVGIALFLTLLAKSGKKVSELRKDYPAYDIYKTKIQLTPEINVDAILEAVKEKFSNEKITDSWVHLRKSNTEPIIRIYSEAHTMKDAEALADSIKAVINSLS